MDNRLLRLKLKQRLNRLASSDYTDLECWQEAELVNKGQRQWVRRQLHGANAEHEGDEQTTTKIDDLQPILVEDFELKGSMEEMVFETELLPKNYNKYKKVIVWAVTPECDTPRRFRADIVEVGNVDDFVIDYNQKPSFAWGETFCTIGGNKIRVYHNGDFIVKKCELTYYRFARDVAFDGCRSWDDTDQTDQTLEFKDDVVELIIDEAVSIAALDSGDFNRSGASTSSVDKNT